MYLSNTTLFHGSGIYSIYYIRYNYMFRRLTVATFRLYMKYLVSSYTRLILAVYSGEVGVEVGTNLVCVIEFVWGGYIAGLSYYMLCLS